MACSLWKLCNVNLNVNISSTLCGSVRHGHHLRGKPPGIAKSLEEKLKELRYQDPALHYKVDIGLPPKIEPRSKRQEEKMKVLKAKKENPELEVLSRNRKLIINLDETREQWLKTSAPSHIKAVADHYGIFDHLYGDAYFYPRVALKVNFVNEDTLRPVYYGNIIKPLEAKNKPEISYETDDNTLWTLILTNPDGHFTEQNKEYVHWFIGNIPGNKIEKGETLVEYLQPFPPKGTGYHRHVFVLYKQNKKIDFSKHKKEGSCLTLTERTFSTLDFYRSLQDDLTPSGLAFFQSDWDCSLKEFFHNTLNMKEPIFEYDFPKHYHTPQKWFPLRQPFNLYLDRYRDPKQINKEFLERKFKKVHPFTAPPPPLPYPNAKYFEGYVPSWLKLEKTKSRLKWGRINDVE